jgi:hypothetical protein
LFNTDPFGYIKLRSHAAGGLYRQMAGRLLGLMYVEVEYRESQKMPDCLESEDSGTFFQTCAIPLPVPQTGVQSELTISV